MKTSQERRALVVTQAVFCTVFFVDPLPSSFFVAIMMIPPRAAKAFLTGASGALQAWSREALSPHQGLLRTSMA